MSCACAYTTPCHATCTCVSPVSSSGCARCCSYGSIEQRREAAKRIALAIPPRAYPMVHVPKQTWKDAFTKALRIVTFRR